MNPKHQHDYKIVHKKALGQNFIEDENLLEQLVALTDVNSEDTVLEIGAGAGALTKQLLNKAGQVISIEIDDRLLPFLRLLESENSHFHLYHGDILTANIEGLIRPFSKEPVKVIANIPYYITSDIIENLLKNKKLFSGIYLMIQKEVGEKIIAKPKEKGYGPLGIFCQYYSTPQILKEVPAAFFVPPPKVDSVFIAMPFKSKEDFSVDERMHEETFLKVVKGAFVMRRKTLENNLQAAFSFSKDEIREILQKANIKDRARGEECSITDFVNISKTIDLFMKNKQ